MVTFFAQEYQLAPEPSSHVFPKARTQKACVPSNLLPFELRHGEVDAHPCQKRFLCTQGGLVAFFTVHQPSKIVANFAATIKNTAIGPNMSDFGIGEDRHVFRPHLRHPIALPFADDRVVDKMEGAETTTCMVLRDYIVDVLSLRGPVMFSFQTCLRGPLHGSDLATRSMASTKGGARLASFKQDPDEIQWLQGHPSCLHWCPMTRQILVGFSSGGVGSIAVPLIRHSASPKKTDHTLQTFFKTQRAHGAEVTKLQTLWLKEGTSSGTPDAPAGVLLVADSSGLLTSWNLLAPAANK